MDFLTGKIRPARGIPSILAGRQRMVAKPEDVGYDTSWGDHHGPVEYDADTWNYGSSGYPSDAPPMPMPKKLYHVSPQVDKILGEGLKTFKDPKQQTFGGHGDYISFTSLPNAKQYMEGLKDVVRAARGELTIEDFNRKWGIDPKKGESMLQNAQRWTEETKQYKPENLYPTRVMMEYLRQAHTFSKFPLFLDLADQGPRFAQMTPEQIGIIEANVDQPMPYSHNYIGTDMKGKYNYNKNETEWRVFSPELIPVKNLKRFEQ